MSRRILITRAGSGPCNNLMRSLVHDDASNVLIGCNSDRFVLKRSPAQRNFLVALPDPEEGSSHAFDRDLRAVIARAAVDLVIPGNDDDALLLARLHEREPLPCRTFLPAAKTIELCHDKYALYLEFRRHNVPVATTYPVSDRASLNRSVARAGATRPRLVPDPPRLRVSGCDQGARRRSGMALDQLLEHDAGSAGRALYALRIPAGP